MIKPRTTLNSLKSEYFWVIKEYLLKWALIIYNSFKELTSYDALDPNLYILPTPKYDCICSKSNISLKWRVILKEALTPHLFL